MVLTVFAGIAEFERALIHQRTSSGRVAARQRGVRFGRPPKLTPEQIALGRRLVDEGTPGRDVAKVILKCPPATLYRELGKFGPASTRANALAGEWTTATRNLHTSLYTEGSAREARRWAPRRKGEVRSGTGNCISILFGGAVMTVWRTWALLAALLTASPFPGRAQDQAPERQVYRLPKNAYPHDVAPAPDGKVWYSAQQIGALGILDLKTGGARHIPLGKGSAPHGVIQGPDGAAWLTDGGQNAIVRFDPKTEAIKVWKLPEDTGYTNLNTAAFDKDGVHWFTGQNGIYGRLDQKSGEVKVFKAPKGRGPYGIASTPDGEVYYVSLAGSFLGKIDRATGETKVIEPPTPNQGARRLWSDSQGRLWVSEWNSGNLSMHDPKANSWKTWKLPGEKPRNYAVYVDERDLVWTTDWGADAVVSFDPKTEKFASYPMSAKGANVRQILGRPGEVWFPESGTERLIVIRTGETQ